MNPFRAIPFGILILTSLVPIQKHKRIIDRARAEGRDEEEIEWIRLAENFWGPKILSNWKATVERTGEAGIPEGGVLFVSNHNGYADIPAFMTAIPEKQFGFVAKEELMKIPIFSKWIVRIRSIMLLREDPRIALKVFQEGEDMLRRGFSLVIFPEGTRSKGLGMRPFQKGSLRMAFRAGVPIVPVATRGSYKCFEELGYPQAGIVQFHIFPTIETAGLPKTDEGSLSDQIEEMIRKKVEEWDAQETNE